MTKNSDFKALVRARMRECGENYTTARAALAASTTPELSEAARSQQILVGRWFDDGRLRAIPAKRKARVGVLLEVLTRFEPGRVYSEKQVSELLADVHPDFAYLRRELVDYGYLIRGDGRYQTSAAPPERPPMLAAEIPAWESEWLPDFLTKGR